MPSDDTADTDDTIDETTPTDETDPTDETIDETTPADDTIVSFPPFSQSATLSRVIVTVTAPAGAFPEGAELVVKRVPVYAEAYREADAAIDALRDEAQNVAVSYTFDIKVIDPVTGEELQPADGHDVEVTFALAEASDANLDANVYHVTEDELTGAVCAEALETDVDAGAVTAVSDGFSVYVVEFTYNTKEYVMQGGDSVALADILDFVGISGAVSSVTVDPSNGLLTVDNSSGEWTVSSAGVFAGEAKLTVAVGNQTYEIIVTCYQKTLYYRDTDGDLATLEGWTPLTEGVSAWGKPGETTWLALTQNLDIDTRITVSGTVNLILCDGCTLKANRGVTVADGDALTIYGGALGAGHIEGTGKLSANAAGVANAAGIGGNGGDSGLITIVGGTVDAKGGENGAGIGGGNNGGCGVITIIDGNVEAIGGSGAAGIGLGASGNGGIINITGGKVSVPRKSGIGSIGGDPTKDINLRLGYMKVYQNDTPVQYKNVKQHEDACMVKPPVRLEPCTHTGDPCQYCGYGHDDTKVYYTDGEGGTQSTEITRIVTMTDDVWTSGWYAAFDDGTTISDRVEVVGTVNLILCDENTLTAAQGIHVGPGSTLNIYAGKAMYNTIDGDGRLIAGGAGSPENCAGIGGDDGEACGTVNVYGGNVDAQGGENGAGIGGGNKGDGGNITVSGGTIMSAIGGKSGAGIGGGHNGDGRNITINGGTVAATGGMFAAGIGGGDDGDGGVINISYGNVNASGGEFGAGIGGGYLRDGGVITISDGAITQAEGGNNGAGIGGGWQGNGGTITISGGTITKAIGGAINYDGGAGIGGGCQGDGGKIAITGGTIAEARGGDGGAGIGGGKGRDGGSITIGGNCTITKAQGGANGAGIGGGFVGSGGDITISGGTIKEAYGGANAAGIGGGAGGSGGAIAISGGTITLAKGNNGGTGIGGGNGGGCGAIKITGGTIDRAEGNNGGAGIGGGAGGSGGTITISGGTINNAVSDYGGAGIGGGTGGSGGAITISGGTINNAEGGYGGAGIGCGDGSKGGTITISGGTINKAMGGDGGAGIGGGTGGSGGEITISGGMITAIGRSSNSAIQCAEDKLTFGRVAVYKNNVRVEVGKRVNECTTHSTVLIKPCAEHDYGTDGKCKYCGFGDASSLYYLDTDGETEETKELGTAYNTVSKDTTEWKNGWYALTQDVKFENRIEVKGDVKLILCDGFTLNADKGIHVPKGESLTVYAGYDSDKIAGTGALVANASSVERVAGIGGNANQACGEITVSGGHVTATGGMCAAGIGGGAVGSGNDITINGGEVTATGGVDDAGIGGGLDGSGKDITINGGEVTATGGKYGAGIGGGHCNLLGGDGSAITINGGTVAATGGYYGAGIGGGYGGNGNNGNGNNGNGSDIEITGGTVTANGGDYGAGIGGGYYGSGSDITISGGTVTATGNGYEGGAGIGGGGYGSGSDITISGGTVTATGGDGGAGIGGGSEGSGSDIEITGGEVEATGDGGGAGIGGGSEGSGSAITISGGAVEAIGGEAAAGIGGGWCGSGSAITISGGAVTATGGESAAGIGGGAGGSGSDITIDGGTVEAIGGYDGKAVGNGFGGSGDSTPTIGDGLKVAAGASRRSAMVYLYADRGTACRTSEYALIEPCADGERVFDPKSHLCKYCGAEQAKVSVVFAPSDTKTVAPGEDSSFTARIGVESAKLTDYAVPVYAEKGDAVTLTFAVAEGYEIKKVEAQDKNGKAVNVGVKNGKYTLTMRGSDVTVTAALKFVPTVTAPTAKDLTYNGKQQELVDPGTTNAGWLEYAFAPDVGERFTPKEGDYSKNIPTRDIGRECYVWYRAVDAYGNKTENKMVPALIEYLPVIVRAVNKEKTYDGTPLTCGKYEYATDIKLPEIVGYDFSVTYSDDSKITNAGTVKNKIVKVKEKTINPYIKVTFSSCVEVSIEDGTLTVKPRKVTITAKDASKYYDKEPLTQPEFTVSGQADSDKHIFDVKMTGDSTITNVGTQPNVIATVDGVAVQPGVENPIGNYLVTVVSGTLEVMPRQESEAKDNGQESQNEVAPVRKIRGDKSLLTDQEKPKGVEVIEDGEMHALVIAPAKLPDGYKGIKYSVDGGKTWTDVNVIPTAANVGEYDISVLYLGDDRHEDLEGDIVHSRILAHTEPEPEPEPDPEQPNPPQPDPEQPEQPDPDEPEEPDPDEPEPEEPELPQPPQPDQPQQEQQAAPQADSMANENGHFKEADTEEIVDPGQPNGVMLAWMVSVDSNALDLSWTKLNNVSGYIIWFAPCGDGKDMPVYAVVFGEDITHFRIDGLKRGMSYKVKVQGWIWADKRAWGTIVDPETVRIIYPDAEGKAEIEEKQKNERKILGVLDPSPEIHCYTNNGDSIHINPSGVTVKYPTMTVRVGNLEKIKPTLHKASKGKFCSHVNEIRYLSSNPKVATVSSSGKVTGRSGGTCIVYALTINGLYATTTVNVDPSPFKISFKNVDTKMEIGTSQDLSDNIAVSPKGTWLETSLSWKSTNRKVLVVDEHGKVTAVGKGNAYIIATYISPTGKKVSTKVSIRGK